MASFDATKSKPEHAVNRNLKPIRVLPLLPDFDRHALLFLHLYILNISTNIFVIFFFFLRVCVMGEGEDNLMYIVVED